MTITHHPSDETLAAHAGGGLPPALGLVVAAHAERCATCRAMLAVLEQLGGALLEQAAPAPLCEDAQARALAAIEQPPRGTAKPRRRAKPAAYMPTALQGLALARWRWGGPGLRCAKIRLDSGATSKDPRAYLLSAQPGSAVPVHSHQGREFTLVLQGAFGDGETIYRTGDFVAADEDILHEPHAEPGEICICLIGSEGVPRFGGMIIRWLGPMLSP